MAKLIAGVLLVVALAGCAGPQSVVIPALSTHWDNELRPVLNELPSEDRENLVRYLVRARSGELVDSRGVHGVPPGTTVGQAVAIQREFEQRRSTPDGDATQMSSDYYERVANINRNIGQGLIDVRWAELFPPYTVHGTPVSEASARELEALQTWWGSSGFLFIHLRNITPHPLTAFQIEYSEQRCEARGLASQWQLVPRTAVGPGEEVVIAFEKQGASTSDAPPGTKQCLTIVSGRW